MQIMVTNEGQFGEELFQHKLDKLENFDRIEPRVTHIFFNLVPCIGCSKTIIF